MTAFDFLTAGNIRFGRGKAETAAKSVAAFGRSVLLVRGRSVAWVSTLIADLQAEGCEVTEVYCTAEPDLPALEAACVTARSNSATVVVAVGGGAVIDLGKAVAALAPGETAALEHLEGVGEGRPLNAAPLPFVAVPTTSGTGAEVTKNAVIAVPEAGRKVSLRDNRMLPDLAIIDPQLTDNAPRSVTLSSGLDAITQVIEPFLCARANPMTDALTRAAIPMGLAAIARLAETEDKTARDDMAFVSLCGGMALANAGLGAVHGLAGVIGGRLGAPHGLICGRLLGPVLTANDTAMRAEQKDTSRFDEVGEWFATHLDVPKSDPFGGLTDLLDTWQVARLGQWMTPETDLHAIAREAAGASSMRANPCELSQDTLVHVMQQAI